MEINRIQLSANLLLLKFFYVCAETSLDVIGSIRVIEQFFEFTLPFEK